MSPLLVKEMFSIRAADRSEGRLKNAFVPWEIYSALRTVPTKYKGFCARLGPRGKRSLQRLLESTKKNVGSHAFCRDN